MHIRGKWLIEIGELAALVNAHPDTLKAFLTRQIEQYTPKFARNEVFEPRQCVFAGSTNKTVYLRDETGNRRTWPVITRRINLNALQADRDQLFAEAVVAFKDGEQYWPDSRFETRHIQPQQETRFVSDAWEPVIADWLNSPVKGEERTICTVPDLAEKALGLEKSKLDPKNQLRITAALERLGWFRNRDKNSRWWERGAIKP